VPALLRKILAVLIISLVMGACNSNGDGGSTWFNLPSVPIKVDANGNGTALGFPIGEILQQPLLDQFAVAGVDVLEVRIGYHGVFFYADGQPLPYLQWSDESTELLGEILANVPGAEQGADALPLLRQVGLGVIVILPTAGQNIPRWQGEELVRRERPSETTIGPLQFGSLAFDANGKASFEGIPMAEIEQSLGVSLGLDLPPMALQILSALGVEQLTIATQPNGIDIALDGIALPSLAYDTRRLNNLLPIVSAFVDPSMGGMIADVLPKLPGADLDIIVSFTGEQAADTQLATIPVSVSEDGSLSAWGIPLGTSPLLPESVLGILGSANVQKLDLNIVQDGLFLALNQEPLPAIYWSDPSLDTIGDVVVDLLGMSPGVVGTGLGIVRRIVEETNIGLSLDLPLAAGQEGLTFAPDFDVTAPNFTVAPDGGETALQIGVSIDGNGALQSVAGISLAELGGILAPVMMPPLVMNIFDSIGADNLALTSSGNALELMDESDTLLAIRYDEAALDRLVVVLSSLADDVSFIKTIDAYLPHLPRILASGLNVQLALGGQAAAETRLASLPVEVKADGALAILGIPLGDELMVPPSFVADMQDLNIQRVDLNIIDASLYLATNGETLPVISWTDQSLEAIQMVVVELSEISSDLLGVGVAFLRNTDVGLALSIPPADGAASVSVPAAFDVTAVRMEPPAIDAEHRPVLGLGLTLHGSEIHSVGGIPADELQTMGMGLPSLPSNIAAILYDSLQVSELELTSTANQLNVVADGEALLTLHYDSPSIRRTLKLATPFLPEQIAAALDDPDIAALLLDVFLPLIVGANLDVTAELVQE
jgi:hypothetical protein